MGWLELWDGAYELRLGGRYGGKIGSARISLTGLYDFEFS
jgi:hypothetical protein